MMAPFDQLLMFRWKGGQANLAETGLDWDVMLEEDACICNFPFSFVSDFDHGSLLGLYLIEHGMSFSRWSFYPEPPRELMAGETYISRDILAFSREDDAIAAKLILSGF